MHGTYASAYVMGISPQRANEVFALHVCAFLRKKNVFFEIYPASAGFFIPYKML
jgi:hypothetical protein